MSPQMKIKLRKFKARAKPLSVVFMMIIVSLTVLFIISPTTIVGADANPNDFDSNIEIIVNSSLIDDDLTNFPLLVHYDGGSLQGNILANASDIAFFDSTNSTQFNHEVESYNATSGELWAWVNVTSVTSGSDTVFYMYYGDSDGGYEVGYNPEDVWDSNYVFVGHCADTDDWLGDSTSNGVNFVENGNPSGYQATGIASYGVDGDGVDDYFTNNTLDVTGYAEMMVEVWYKSPSYSADDKIYLFGSRWNTAPEDVRFGYKEGATGTGDTGCDYTWDDSVDEGGQDYNHDADTNWHYYVTSIDANSHVYGYRDKVRTLTDSSVNFDFGNMDNLHGIGARSYHGSPLPFRGILDEVRISDLDRSHAWLNATFDSINGTTGFITFNEITVETPTNGSILGLTNNRITWSGLAGETVWSNSSGDANETLELNLTVNATTNISEIRVYVAELNDTDTDVNASQITLFVSVDNSTWRNFSNFDGINNITLNATTWTDPDDPFNIETNMSLYMRFKLEIPVGQDPDDYYSASTDAWKIYLFS